VIESHHFLSHIFFSCSSGVVICNPSLLIAPFFFFFNNQLWTGAVATILPYVTYVITDWALIMYEAWVERKAATNRQKQLKIKQGAAAAQTPLLKAVFPKLLESGQSNVTGWALGVVGGSMGTLVWPGTGTMIGQLVPELAIELMK
jgi:hypothetical protein